ncbi:hypothetical protein HSE3_gp039 [Bacillus phage vB_BceM-HSE3]|nr:hypothetical protein HSE3_gp039 [Bacillus phage vB_BceM-HSE3]
MDSIRDDESKIESYFSFYPKMERSIVASDEGFGSEHFNSLTLSKYGLAVIKYLSELQYSPLFLKLTISYSKGNDLITESARYLANIIRANSDLHVTTGEGTLAQLGYAINSYKDFITYGIYLTYNNYTNEYEIILLDDKGVPLDKDKCKLFNKVYLEVDETDVELVPRSYPFLIPNSVYNNYKSSLIGQFSWLFSSTSRANSHRINVLTNHDELVRLMDIKDSTVNVVSTGKYSRNIDLENIDDYMDLLEESERLEAEFDIILLINDSATQIGVVVPDEEGNYMILPHPKVASLVNYFYLLARDKKKIPAGSGIIKTLTSTPSVLPSTISAGLKAYETVPFYDSVSRIINRTTSKSKVILLGMTEYNEFIYSDHTKLPDALATAYLLIKEMVDTGEDALLDYLEDLGSSGPNNFMESVVEIFGDTKEEVEEIKRIYNYFKETNISPFLGTTVVKEDFEEGTRYDPHQVENCASALDHIPLVRWTSIRQLEKADYSVMINMTLLQDSSLLRFHIGANSSSEDYSEELLFHYRELILSLIKLAKTGTID